MKPSNGNLSGGTFIKVKKILTELLILLFFIHIISIFLKKIEGTGFFDTVHKKIKFKSKYGERLVKKENLD